MLSTGFPQAFGQFSTDSARKRFRGNVSAPVCAGLKLASQGGGLAEALVLEPADPVGKNPAWEIRASVSDQVFGEGHRFPPSG